MGTRPSSGSAGHISIETLRMSRRSMARNMRPSAAAGPRPHARLQTAKAQAGQSRRPAPRSRPRTRLQRTKTQAAQNQRPARSRPRTTARKPSARRSSRCRRQRGWSCIRAYNSRAWRRAFTPVFNEPSAAHHLANSGRPRAACSNKSSMRSLIGLFCMPSAPVAEPRR